MSSLDLLELDDELSLTPWIAVRVVLQGECAESFTYLVLVGISSDLQVSVVISRSISFDHGGRSGMRCARWDEARESGWLYVVSSTRQPQPQSLSCAARSVSRPASRGGAAQLRRHLGGILGAGTRAHGVAWRGESRIERCWGPG